jgi:hypothetical protein
VGLVEVNLKEAEGLGPRPDIPPVNERERSDAIVVVDLSLWSQFFARASQDIC